MTRRPARAPAVIRALMARQYRARAAAPDTARIKVNLYTATETLAVAQAAAARPAAPIDCLMVADSYLMTHLGRSSTRLAPSEQAPFLETMLDLIEDVAGAAADGFGNGADAPYILGDLPDGSHATPARALDAMKRMGERGAEAIKLEVATDADFGIVEAATAADIPIVVHLGYTPQTAENHKHGADLPGALALIDRARRARDAGAAGLVLERVSEAVLARLAAPAPRGLPIHAIFCGRSRYAGQSLNVWDSTIKPDQPFKRFPPTATLGRADYPAGYTQAVIARHFGALLDLALAGDYPKGQPDEVLAAALDKVVADDPWG